jgi:RNA polymerase sigma-70 factor (ECF subfamily)
MYLASRPRFVRQAYSILQNQEDAEDAVQNAFVSAYLHLRTFEGRSAFTTWFTRIVMNASLMILRKRRNLRLDPILETGTTDEPSWTEKIPASQPDPEMVYAEQETVRLIETLLGNLSPALRQAFTMTYCNEMSGAEAAASLGIKTSTFKARLFRARRQLMNQTQRSLVAPIPNREPHSARFSENHEFQAIAARPIEIAFSEILAS